MRGNSKGTVIQRFQSREVHSWRCRANDTSLDRPSNRLERIVENLLCDAMDEVERLKAVEKENQLLKQGIRHLQRMLDDATIHRLVGGGK